MGRIGAARRPATVAAAVVAVAAVAVLSGCARSSSIDDPMWNGSSTPPPTAEATDRSTDDEPEARDGPQLPPTPPQPRVDVGFRMPRLSPEAAPGLVPRLAAMAQPGLTVVARWATPQGASALGDLLDASIANAVRAYAAQRGLVWTPGVDIAPGGVGDACAPQPLTMVEGASLTVDCAIVAAAGTTLGERIIVIHRDEVTAPSLDRVTWYTDAATGELGDGAALYRAGAEARVLGLIAEGLRAAGLAGVADPFAGHTAAGIRTILADTVVTPDDFIVPMPLLGGSDSRGRLYVPVLVPARLLAPFLSPFGAAVHAAIGGGAPYDPETAPTGADSVDCTLVACVSITFDDGPSSLTEDLVGMLRDLRAPATFFLQGVAVERRPAVVRRLVAEGHQLGNHTWGHPQLTKLPDAEVRAEIHRTQAAITAASGVVPSMLRPPYGDLDQRVRDLAGLPIVVWDVDTKDWTTPGVDLVVERAVSWAARGSIVLLHDTHEETLEAVPDVIGGLRDRGFTFATVGEQFGGVLPAAGETVSHGPS